MKYNLAQLPQCEMDKINVDLAAAGVAFKERYDLPVVAEAVEAGQPQALRDWFRQRLEVHRASAHMLDRLPPNESRLKSR